MWIVLTIPLLCMKNLSTKNPRTVTCAELSHLVSSPASTNEPKNRSGLSTRYTKLKIIRCLQSDFGSEREVVLGNAPFDLRLNSLTSHKDEASAETGAVKALAAVRHCR
jgi:hypothetical protein